MLFFFCFAEGAELEEFGKTSGKARIQADYQSWTGLMVVIVANDPDGSTAAVPWRLLVPPLKGGVLYPALGQGGKLADPYSRTLISTVPAHPNG
ncbi:hypothetical protein [Alkalilimnicola sp. S0819]|uniref:hypothetical protein n=1 Tax=Alkalilimnicola sp. S0819 TaxID=2613922 RepID=UPI0012623FE4|nr:hypothetical protein [Alkalilimnicola sp. S0819]KAB7619436.1 hypothetical protein F3N43_13785 [Alkalilimnicola sp. S0819]MPQ17708.1 hypothetical protein [Alkalilimnicola sp. S0819]